MSKEFQVLNFSSNLAYNIQIFYLLPIKDLDGYFVASQLVFSNWKSNFKIMVPYKYIFEKNSIPTLDFSKGSNTKSFTENIMPYFHQWFLLGQHSRAGDTSTFGHFLFANKKAVNSSSVWSRSYTFVMKLVYCQKKL